MQASQNSPIYRGNDTTKKLQVSSNTLLGIVQTHFSLTRVAVSAPVSHPYQNLLQFVYIRQQLTQWPFGLWLRPQNVWLPKSLYFGHNFLSAGIKITLHISFSSIVSTITQWNVPRMLRIYLPAHQLTLVSSHERSPTEMIRINTISVQF